MPWICYWLFLWTCITIMETLPLVIPWMIVLCISFCKFLSFRSSSLKSNSSMACQFIYELPQLPPCSSTGISILFVCTLELIYCLVCKMACYFNERKFLENAGVVWTYLEEHLDLESVFDGCTKELELIKERSEEYSFAFNKDNIVCSQLSQN